LISRIFSVDKKIKIYDWEGNKKNNEGQYLGRARGEMLFVYA